MEGIPGESVKHEAERRGLSLSQIRQERRERPELQVKKDPDIEVGKTYKDSYGRLISIIGCLPDTSEVFPFIYEASTGGNYTAKGKYPNPEPGHKSKLDLVEEVLSS